MSLRTEGVLGGEFLKEVFKRKGFVEGVWKREGFLEGV